MTHLRDDAIAIWRAGVAAVDSATLVADVVRIEGRTLFVAGETFALDDLDRVVVLGGGKAGAGMAAGIVDVFDTAGELGRLTGWVNVPADCVRSLPAITLHAARPAGVNEPTAEGVHGTERILELARSLGPRDLAIVLLSGGGSALLPAPAEGITLADKQDVTRRLMHAGATIGELNAVRRRLSRIKGGGLARAAAGAARVVTLVVSDVVGDPLDVIASGPTVPDPAPPEEAVAVVDRSLEGGIATHVRECLARERPCDVPGNVVNRIIGNNAVAVRGSRAEAERRGYITLDATGFETGIASEVGRALAERARRERDRDDRGTPLCLLTGGEPTVRLAETDRPRRGGRNQELALAAIEALWEDGGRGLVVLSGGTDGEDGPTDAAGGIADADVIARAKRLGLDPAAHLAINDSYGFLDPAGGLLVTGPTHTNVMDVRVVLVK